ncbi:MAG TPA: hypothetical protein VHM31_20585 [Polyangia bacterium]|nr:hypothetical protein [Polyangia bacterium]
MHDNPIVALARFARFLWKHLWFSALLTWAAAGGLLWLAPSFYLWALPIVAVAVVLSGIAVLSPVSKR